MRKLFKRPFLISNTFVFIFMFWLVLSFLHLEIKRGTSIRVNVSKVIKKATRVLSN